MNTTKEKKAQSAKQSKTVIRSFERTEVTKWIAVDLAVPAQFAAVLEKPGYYAVIPSASVDPYADEIRVAQWTNSTSTPGGKARAKERELESIRKMTFDATIHLCFAKDEWRRIQTVCKTLGITTDDWLLAGVYYNAMLEIRNAAKAA